MATHGTEDAARRHDEYMKAEVASLGARLQTVEDKLAQVRRDLARLERIVGMVGPEC